MASRTRRRCRHSLPRAPQAAHHLATPRQPAMLLSHSWGFCPCLALVKAGRGDRLYNIRVRNLRSTQAPDQRVRGG
eukprot:849129-Prymnesium_polylepis.1